MKAHYSSFLSILLLASLLIQCNRVKEIPLEHTNRIYPLETGNQRIYHVIDTTFTVQDIVVDEFFRLERVGETELDLKDREVHRIDTYRSPFDQGNDYSFVFDRVWTHYKGTEFVEEMEENTHYLSLKFPVYEDLSWNGNLLNNLGFQAYRYGNIDTTVVVNGVNYPNCVYVIQNLDTTGVLSYKFAYEIYAPDVGKIKSYNKNMVFDGGTGGFNPDKSFIHIEYLVE